MKRFHILMILEIAALFAVVFPSSVQGQGARATLGGRVTDSQGAVVPGAEVIVRSDDTGVKQQTVTNGQGNWTVQFLVPGHYSFTASAPGFKEMERHGITLQT